MIQTAKIWAVTGVAVALLCGTNAWPAPWETLVMPGRVIEEHAKYELECSKCHTRFNKASQTELCLACHEEIAADIRNSEGFHGKSQSVSGSECRVCHTEHEGRDADVVKLNKETFDHDPTDFALKYAHLKAPCDSCHDRGKAYAQAPSACHSCHENDDPHQGRLGEKCSDCHNTASWHDVAYDHNQTHFPLDGKHQEIACGICHPGERYEHTPSTCISCHRLNDVHRGRNGTKCESCHTPRAWDDPKFDHGKDTDFPLSGRHAKITCHACHLEPVEKTKPDSDCYACHQNDDDHHGRHGRKCNTCHDSESWSHAKFDHDNKTDFPLLGAHTKLRCGLCHRGDAYNDKRSSSCIDCHQTDDVHKGQEGRTCERCHSEQGWGKDILFDHDLTRFPLVGMHSAAPCAECHISGEFKHAAVRCTGCHERDDKHEGTLGPKCEQCHNPNAWGLWLFDHDNQTGFVLDGAHDELTCDACHTTPTKNAVKQTKVCETCHRRDDVHSGSFGRNCDRCHNTKSFTDVSLGR